MLSLQQSLNEEQEQCRCDCSAATVLSSELQNRMLCQRTEFETEIEAMESQRHVLQHEFNEEHSKFKSSMAFHRGELEAKAKAQASHTRRNVVAGV